MPPLLFFLFFWRKITEPLKKNVYIYEINHATSPKLYRSYDPHRSRDSLSPVCGIFSNQKPSISQVTWLLVPTWTYLFLKTVNTWFSLSLFIVMHRRSVLICLLLLALELIFYRTVDPQSQKGSLIYQPKTSSWNSSHLPVVAEQPLRYGQNSSAFLTHPTQPV